MVRIMRSILFFSLLVNVGAPVGADDGGGEYKVVVVQAMRALPRLEKQATGFYVDTVRTRLVNELAADGWEVVSVIGQPLGDHVIYFQRSQQK